MIKNLSKKRKKKGFTLIELIIVLAVMAIIALIAVPNFTAIRDNSKTKTDDRSREVIDRTINMLVADETIPDNGTYTVTFEGTPEVLKVVASGITDNAKLTAAQASVTEALNEVNKPAGKVDAKDSDGKNKDCTGYIITVTKGKVEVVKTPTA